MEVAAVVEAGERVELGELPASAKRRAVTSAGPGAPRDALERVDGAVEEAALDERLSAASEPSAWSPARERHDHPGPRTRRDAQPRRRAGSGRRPRSRGRSCSREPGGDALGLLGREPECDRAPLGRPRPSTASAASTPGSAATSASVCSRSSSGSSRAASSAREAHSPAIRPASVGDALVERCGARGGGTPTASDERGERTSARTSESRSAHDGEKSPSTVGRRSLSPEIGSVEPDFRSLTGLGSLVPCPSGSAGAECSRRPFLRKRAEYID